MTASAAFPLPPGSTIGILGTGQLGLMLALAAAKLGFRSVVLGPDEAPPAARVSQHIQAAYTDEAALTELAKISDVVTFEFENVPPEALATLEGVGAAVAPNGKVLEVCQDRLFEKSFLREHGIGTAPFYDIKGLDDLRAALADLDGPAILKSRRFGYDGKGQIRINAGDDPALAYDAVSGVPSVLEGIVPFDKEFSVIAARGRNGVVAFFDSSENHHQGGILQRSTVPAAMPSAAVHGAQDMVRVLMDKLGYVGVMTVEFFWVSDAGAVANEIAPRVHNSGHWTVEACHVSQFEQHIRAVAGWPLGDPTRHADAVMVNLLGDAVTPYQALAADQGTSLTLYNKGTPKPGRKMGHLVRTTPIRASGTQQP